MTVTQFCNGIRPTWLTNFCVHLLITQLTTTYDAFWVTFLKLRNCTQAKLCWGNGLGKQTVRNKVHNPSINHLPG